MLQSVNINVDVVDPPTPWLVLPLICWCAHVFPLSLPSRLMDLREVCETHHGKYAYVYKRLLVHVLQTFMEFYLQILLVRHMSLDQTYKSPWVSLGSSQIGSKCLLSCGMLWVFSITALW